MSAKPGRGFRTSVPGERVRTVDRPTDIWWLVGLAFAFS
jgi:hypothetical protein